MEKMCAFAGEPQFAFLLAQNIDGSAKAGCKFLDISATPVVQKDDGWLGCQHVVVDGDNIEFVRPEGFQDGIDCTLAHGDIECEGVSW